jgi:hypothetical protein
MPNTYGRAGVAAAVCVMGRTTMTIDPPLVFPPNFRDVAETVGTVVAIVGGAEAAKGQAEIGPGPAAPASPRRFQASGPG